MIRQVGQILWVEPLVRTQERSDDAVSATPEFCLLGAA